MQVVVPQFRFNLRFDGARLWKLIRGGENKFDEFEGRKWIAEHYGFICCVAVFYLIFIFGVQRFMKDRKPFDLQYPLAAWNLCLAIFSTTGMIRIFGEWYGIFNRPGGYLDAYCVLETLMEPPYAFWMFAMMISKVFELIDTVFIVLRKKPLIFLHWYHHVLTMFYAFYSHPHAPAFNRYGVLINYSVHAVMYSYFFLRAIGIRLPGFVAKIVTTLQISQFVVSLGMIAEMLIRTAMYNIPCHTPRAPLIVATLMDCTYLPLFIHFFLKAYVWERKKKDEQKDEPIQHEKNE